MGADWQRTAAITIARMAGDIATARRAARRHAPNGLSALPAHRAHFPIVLQRGQQERRRCAAAIPATASTLTGTMTVSGANDWVNHEQLL